jgi:hypothetical protein
MPPSAAAFLLPASSPGAQLLQHLQRLHVPLVCRYVQRRPTHLLTRELVLVGPLHSPDS